MQEIRYSFQNFECDIAWDSIIGTREEQQDSYYIGHDKSSLLAVVCDGMGGLTAGNEASDAAVSTIRTLYKKKTEGTCFQDFFCNAVDDMDEAVCNLSRLQKDGRRCGTTVAAIAVQDDKLFWLSCGDSRIYIIRNDEIVQVTRDHNYRMELDVLLKRNRITAWEYQQKMQNSDALISYIGMGGVDLFDRNSTPFCLRDNDIIILTSDGLYRNLPQNELLSMASSDESNLSIIKKMFSRASYNANASQDNTTAILLKYRRKKI